MRRYICYLLRVKTEVCQAGGRHTVKDNQRWCDRCRPVSKERARQRVVKHRERRAGHVVTIRNGEPLRDGLTIEERVRVDTNYERVVRWRADYARHLQAAPSDIAVRMKAGPVGQADAILEGMEELLRLLRRRNRGQS